MDQSDYIRCKDCPAAFFTLKKDLYAHIRRFHDKEFKVVKSTKPESMNVKKKRVENVDIHNYASSSSRGSRLKCPFGNCFDMVSNYQVLRCHLQNDHSICIEEESFKFQSMEEFNKWKYIIEEKNLSFYSLDTGAKSLSSDIIKQYYNCHRSYNYKPKGKNIRSLKSTGSNKIGKACPSRIEVVIKGGIKYPTSVEVKYWKTHYGHSVEIGHTFLGKETRIQLAGKLQQGVTFQHIIDEIRESNLKEGLGRSHLLEKKDLHNIVRDFNLSYTTKKHSNDAVSVHLWVKEVQELGEMSPVLRYKNQNEDDNDLTKDDFFLVLMTNFQEQQLRKFGANIICIDGTHGLNAYDIQLFTLLVVDEYGKGCPVAFCFCNRSDELVFKLFYESIKGKVGKISANIFMTDDAPAFYNAWLVVMDEVPHRLLCSWHVDRNWQHNLNKISNIEKRSTVYKTLKVVLHIDCEDKFNQALSKVVTDLLLDEETINFGNYFKEYYRGRTKLWAYCYRQHLGINTNMYLESVHKTLKYYYLEGKKTKRLDKTIHAVMKLARDSLFNRIIKISKNTSSLRINSIQMGHKSSKSINSDMITTFAENEWLVQSCSISGQQYLVQKITSQCNISNCSLKCIECNICVHTYKCSCMDSVIKFNICKHIHAISLYGQLNDFSYHTCTSTDVDNNDQSKDKELKTIISASNMNVNCTKNQDLRKKVELFVGLYENSSLNENENSQLTKLVDKAIDILNKNQIKFCNEKSVNTNENNEKQIRLFSTKKKQVKNIKHFQRPSIFEEKNIKDSLEGKDRTMVFSSANDHTYT